MDTTRTLTAGALLALASLSTLAHSETHTDTPDQQTDHNAAAVRYCTEDIDGLEIFYREAGHTDKPKLVLLHGFPTSSHMFRDLIAMLADDFHIIAPDYPGFGMSSAPSTDDFDYTFDNIADIVDELLERKDFDSYSIYVMDYGAPVGFRIATEHPDRIEGIIVQNGNAYDEGLREFWEPIKHYWNSGEDEHRDELRGLLTLEATKWQFTVGVRDPQSIAPDNWLVTQPLLDRPGNQEIQLDLFYDYSTNPPLYPEWQSYFREHQPPMLITWGANDPIFPEEGAHPYLRDNPSAEMHILDTGHFALEEDGQTIAHLITDFAQRRILND